MRFLFLFDRCDFIEPLGPMQVAAALERMGWDIHVRLLDRIDLLREVRRVSPDWVGFSATTGTHRRYEAANRAIKAAFPHIKTCIGGPHPTYFPEDCLSYDLVWRGEADTPVLTTESQVVLGTYTEDLDLLPDPSRGAFYRDVPELRALKRRSFMASRGCPYSCTYCFNHKFREIYKGKPPIRRRSVGRVIEELLKVKKEWGLEIVKFYDDLFPFEPGRGLEEFAHEYRTKVNLPFHCLTRAEHVTDDFARLLKEAGCYSMSISIECGNEEYRRKYLRRNMSDNTIRKAFETCRKYGINTFANTILGLPGTRLEDEFKSVELNLEVGADLALFPIFHPYPRTELAETARAMGLWDGDFSTYGISYMEPSPLNFPPMRKRIQNNLALLGTVAAVFPKAWPVIKRLARMRENKLFFFLYYLCKMWVVERKIYPGGIGIAGLVRNMFLDLAKFRR